jgi:hypothetical protein
MPELVTAVPTPTRIVTDATAQAEEYDRTEGANTA